MPPFSRLFLVSALALHATAPFAYESHLVYRPDAQPVYEIRYFSIGDGLFMRGDPPHASTWNLNQRQKGKILHAMQYWADVIKPAPGYLPAVVNVGTYDDENAAGSSAWNDVGGLLLTQLQMALQGSDPGPGPYDSQAQFIMGTFDFDTVPYIPAQVPSTGRVDVMSTALHELAHGLGITTSAWGKDGNRATPYFFDTLTDWTTRLRDDNGRPAQPDQAILCGPCSNPVSADAFDLRKDQGYFTGRHVDEVLAGSMPGIPVKILGEEGRIDSNYMSHIELKNSTMSHQDYGNYASFMEAELAVMQDLGYDIDRRNFFGRSIYNDGLTVVNDQGYFQRNAQGTAYLPGTYNTAMLGLGLHIYGSRNTVYQRADLLTKGPGGAGIRVDGEANTVVIEPGTRIHADGLNGRGVAFAYGRNHVLVQRGEVQALGDLGIAAAFDFGSSTLGDNLEYRGSYLRRTDGKPAALLDELKGALVERYDLTGRVAGRQAAIYLSPNALVNHINVMRGAHIEGDIVSRYAQADENGKPRLTQLSFGQLPDTLGQATGRPDPDFTLRYQGNIQGPNIALSAQGGQTSLNGQHDLHSVHVLAGATLGGNSRYTLQPGQALVNDGTVAPGNSLGRIDIIGDYQQGAQGTLALEVDGQGGRDSLLVSGNARLDGQLAIIPLQDWYPSDWAVNFDQLVQAGATTGAFAAVSAVSPSPTLSFQAAGQGTGPYRLTATRAAQAYSRYAQDDNTRQVGQALDRIAGIARPDIQPLYKALDFSAADGSTIAAALEPLSGTAYSTLFAGNLQREQQIADIARHHLGLPAIAWSKSGSSGSSPGHSGAPTDGTWRGYAAPFGAGIRQDRRDSQIGYDASSYGAVFGAHTGRQDWIIGAYTALSEQTIKLRDSQHGTGRSTALHLGLHAGYAPGSMADNNAAGSSPTGPFLFGQGQVGIEQAKLDRQLSIGSYQAKHRADWTGYSAGLTAGGGYSWALSPTLSAGPVASLGYTYLHRPGLSESGSDATRLRLDSASFSSLRSSLGARASLNVTLKNQAMLTAQLQAAWEHELLNRDLTQHASFAGYPDQGFSTRNTIVGADALAIKASVSYVRDDKLTIGAGLSSQFLRAGYRAIAGDLSVNWRF